MNSAKNFHNTLTAKLKWMTASVYRRSTSFHVQILQQVTSVFTLCFQWFLWEVLVSAAYSSVQQTRTTYKDKCKAWLGRELARLFIAEWFCWRNKYWILPFPRILLPNHIQLGSQGPFSSLFSEVRVERGSWKRGCFALEKVLTLVCEHQDTLYVVFSVNSYGRCSKTGIKIDSCLINEKIRFVSFVLMTCLL